MDDPSKTEDLRLNRDNLATQAQNLLEATKTGVQTLSDNVRTDEFRVTGDAVLAKIKELVHEGTVRSITIKGPDGNTLVHFPLTVGVIGAVFLPMWAAMGAVVALVADCSIVVERNEPAPPAQ